MLEGKDLGPCSAACQFRAPAHVPEPARASVSSPRRVVRTRGVEGPERRAGTTKTPQESLLTLNGSAGRCRPLACGFSQEPAGASRDRLAEGSVRGRDRVTSCHVVVGPGTWVRRGTDQEEAGECDAWVGSSDLPFGSPRLPRTLSPAQPHKSFPVLQQGLSSGPGGVCAD